MPRKNTEVEVDLAKEIRKIVKKPLKTIRDICLCKDAPREKLRAILITCDKTIEAIDSVEEDK